MSRKCDLTGKGKLKGRTVSHSNKKTLRHWRLNLRKVRVWHEGSLETINVSMKVYKLIKKGEMQGVELYRKNNKI